MTDTIMLGALVLIVFLAGRDWHRYVKKYRPAWNGPITINNNAPSVAYPDYAVSAEPGAYYPTEEDVQEFVNGLADNTKAAHSNPYRGWGVFDDDEAED